MMDWEWWSENEHNLEHVHGIIEAYVEVISMEI